MTTAKQILLDELNEQVHPERVEDVIFWALEYYANSKPKAETFGKVIANTIKERILEAEKIQLSDVDNSDSLLERAMLTLDDYLNAGSKEKRSQAAENAKFIYKEYYGIDYVNRNLR